MRANGSVWLPMGLALGDHLCWVYDNEAEFVDMALRHVADGLMRGERVLCVVDDPVRSALAGLDPAHLLIAGTQGAALVLTSVAQAYGSAEPRTPEQQLEFYVAAAAQAQADGYTGLRVLAEVTEIALDAERASGQLRWELLADAALARGAPMSALCAYRGDLVDPSVLDAVCCAHPLLRSPARPEAFRMFYDAERLVLAGSIHDADAARLGQLLAATPPRGGELAVDLRLVESFDQQAVRVLAQWTGSAGAG